MVNSDYISARDNWNNDTQPREREEILRQLGYNTQENTTWDKLPKYVRKKLENMYADTLYPDETLELQSGQDYHCNPGEIWVPSYHTKDGKFVHGYCRKR
jgi:hypothetical protein